MARAFVICVLACCAACTTSSPRRPALAAPELLSLPSDPSSAAPLISRDEAFGLDADMRAFVAAEVTGAFDPGARLQQLLHAMEDRGLFALEYAVDRTRTATATFHERQGNCLSFTMLFVGLAREAGFEVTYQMVTVPPDWSTNSGFVVVSNHINTLVDIPFGTDYIVDFNLLDYRGDYPTRKVPDSYALALFYNNLGAEALLRQEYAQSMQYLRAAIEAQSDIPDPWSNLGLLHFTQGRFEQAEAAYLHALAIDARDRTALTNLVSLHRARGNQALADEYGERIRRYQQRNPYFHFAAAQTAYDGGRFADALAPLARALRLKRDEHRFHFLQGLAYFALHETRSADASFEQALRFAEPVIRARYEEQIAALAAPEPQAANQ